MLKKMAQVLSVSLLLSGAAMAYADEGNGGEQAPVAPVQVDSVSDIDREGQIPEQVTSDHWAYKEVAAFVEKFGVEKCHHRLSLNSPNDDRWTHLIVI